MKKGKVKDALRLLSDDPKGAPLPLDLVLNADEGTDRDCQGSTSQEVPIKKTSGECSTSSGQA